MAMIVVFASLDREALARGGGVTFYKSRVFLVSMFSAIFVLTQTFLAKYTIAPALNLLVLNIPQSA